MRKLVLSLLAMLAFTSGAASADQICGADVHSRFSETRAYFRDVLGACRPDGYCSAVIALSGGGGAAYRQQLRIARPTPGAAYVVEFVAVDPMPAGDGSPMALQFGRDVIDISSAHAAVTSSVNEFRITDQAVADDLVARLKRGRSARWTYQSEAGPAQATLPLNGVTAALAWIDCMGAR